MMDKVNCEDFDNLVA